MDYPLVFMSANGTNWPESLPSPSYWYRYNVWVSGALCTAYGLVFCAGLIGKIILKDNRSLLIKKKKNVCPQTQTKFQVTRIIIFLMGGYLFVCFQEIFWWLLSSCAEAGP
jgi:hypothetical protein